MSTRYKAGDKFIASADLNRFGLAADRILSTPPRSPVQELPGVLVKNTTGGNLDRYKILGLGDLAIDPASYLNSFKNSTVIEGTTPALADHWGKFAVLLEPIPAGKYGRAAMQGLAHVQINIVDEAHQFADIDDGDADELITAPVGSARILAKQSGTGTKWAIVHLQAGLLLEEIIPVALTEDGAGADGDGTTAATWDYDVATLGGYSIETGLDPTAAPHNWNREYGLTTAATKGSGYYQINAGGTAIEFVLHWLDESYSAEECS